MEVLNFDNYDIRTTEYSGQTWYSVVDVMGAMSNSSNPGAYWRNLKKRLAAEGNQSVSNCYGLKLEAANGKYVNHGADLYNDGRRNYSIIGYKGRCTRI